MIMEYQTVMNLLNNTPNQPNRFRIKNWVEINDDARGTYNTNSQKKIKTSMLKSSLCDHSDPYILISETRTVPNTEAAADPSNRKNIVIKNSAQFTDCISEINNTKIDNAQEMEIVMPM